jgi:hypothetical protein
VQVQPAQALKAATAITQFSAQSQALAAVVVVPTVTLTVVLAVLVVLGLAWAEAALAVQQRHQVKETQGVTDQAHPTSHRVAVAVRAL